MNTTGPIRVLDRVFQVSGPEQDGSFRPHLTRGHFHDPIVNTMAGLVCEECVCLDIGANLGMITMWLASRAHKGTVYAFEPNPPTYQLLRRNIADNLLTNVSCHNLALSNETGQLHFKSIDYDLGCSFALREMDKQSARVHSDLITVPAVSVDSFVAEADFSRLDFIKIDVEGFELDVLAGCVETLRVFRPMVLVEFNSCTLVRFADLSPRTALARIRALFPETYFVNRQSGLLEPILTEQHQDSVVYNNLTGGLVDNLVCAFPEHEILKRNPLIPPVACVSPPGAKRRPFLSSAFGRAGRLVRNLIGRRVA